MFNFFKKSYKNPIDSDDSVWLSRNLYWINKNLMNLATQPTILPTKKYFKHEFTGSEEDAYFVLSKLGEYFKINTEKIHLGFYSENKHEPGTNVVIESEDGKGTAGLYLEDRKSISILIENKNLKNPHSLIATMAHELSHYVLLNFKKVGYDGIENEWFTDLVTIAYGFGIFLGNTKFEFSQWQDGDGWAGWSYSISGYLPQQIIAHAMAEIEMKKSDAMPSWVKYLKGDFKKDFIKSHNFFAPNQAKLKKILSNK